MRRTCITAVHWLCVLCIETRPAWLKRCSAIADTVTNNTSTKWRQAPMAYTLASTLDVFAEREARAIDIPGVGKG